MSTKEEIEDLTESDCRWIPKILLSENNLSFLDKIKKTQQHTFIQQSTNVYISLAI